MSSSVPSYSGDPPRVVLAEKPEQFIDRQLRRTRRQVRFVDLAVALVQLAAGLLTALLLLIVVDHWVFGLGVWGRSLAFAGLIAATVWFVAVRIAPLLLRPISALYAARTVEQSEPTLKNSLINFLLFRAQPAGIHPGVFEILQDRAALDLQRVPLEIVVDRSRLIRVGYVLAAISAVAAAYAILSPKDPLQTVKRVSAPWADIARPARVIIEDVRPGDSEVYQGQPIEVSATVRGAVSQEQVQVLYTTADAQAVERPVAMRLDDNGLRYQTGLLTESGGVQQDITYRIRAGDAVSRAFRLHVSPAPVIRIERVDYDYPPYMKRSPRSVPDDGHLKAPEGTRVTVHARANYPIRAATLEFDAPTAGAPTTETVNSGTRRLPMDVQGAAARQDWLLELLPDRRTPQHGSYQISFVTSSGHAADKPLLYPIEVLPDLSPEIEILTPEKDQTDLPADAAQKIEVRALDPDFGLSAVRLRAVVGGVEVVQADLFTDPAGHSGQLIVPYVFQPARLGLTAGDDVVFWATAEDNRTSPGDQTPAPNVERTRNYRFHIVAPREPANQGNADGAAKPERQQPTPAKPEQNTQGGQDNGQPGSQQSSGAAGEQRPQDGQSEQGTGASSGGQSSTASQQQPEKTQGSPQGATGSTSDPADASASPKTNDSESRGTGESGTAQEQPKPGEGSGGTAPDDPPREEPLHDGEIFERTLEHMQRKPSADSQNPPGSAANSNPATDAPSEEGSTPPPGSASQDQPGSPASSAAASTRDDRDKPGGSRSGEPESTPAQNETTQRQDGQPMPAAHPNDESPKGEPRGAESQPASKEEAGRGPQETGQPGLGGSGQEPQDQVTSGSQEGDGKRTGGPSQSGTSTEQGAPTQGERSPQTTGDPMGSGDQPQGSASKSDAGTAARPGAGKTVESPGNPADRTSPSDQQGAAKDPGNPDATAEQGQPPGSGGPLVGNSGETASPQTQPNPTTESTPQAGAKPDGRTAGGGAPADGNAQRQAEPGEVPDSEAANLEYARRATDMVLDYLDHQKTQPDEKLLDDLGWTAEDLQQFLQRWQQLKQSARDASAGQRQLDESLRSLGLRPSGDRVRTGQSRADEMHGLRDSGLRSAPPPQYLEQFDAFKKGTARTRN